jgi:hypothetical protein
MLKSTPLTTPLQLVLLGLAVVAIYVMFTNYNKGKSLMGMTNPLGQSPPPLASGDSYAPVTGINTNTYGMQQYATKSTENPSSLLPPDSNSDWAALNPSGNGQLQGINLMKAGALTGINTVGSSLRNANLQLRSEPPNPRMNSGPWNQSTIDSDLMRTPFELNCGSQ